MKILICRCFGIGNAIMAIPMIRAIISVQPESRIDLLIGNTSDDVGAWNVFSILRARLLNEWSGGLGIYINEAKDVEYDLAILAIPYDGRWMNGVHFRAKEVWDGRTRPDPSTTGLMSWKKHEVEYQMENANRLGYCGETPPIRFLTARSVDEQKFYLGVGYKKDAAGFWKIKHWGNERFAALAQMILDDNPRNMIVTTGDMADVALSINPIFKLIKTNLRVRFYADSLDKSFQTVATSGWYVGNDTGMMHAAASFGNRVVAAFNLENSIVKSRPWCPPNQYRALDGSKAPVTPEQMFAAVKELSI